ncbi:unnamed protein product [Linum trigynum]|uniref:Uncharacterized protein n=1 Tax=Linum trigynum TaxID=586398 RepID=A0AAV2E5K2_9ROSI
MRAEESGFKITTSIEEVTEMVDLMDHTNRARKRSLLQHFFNQQDMARTEGIPVPRQPSLGERIWGYEKIGNYWVKTGYTLCYKEMAGTLADVEDESREENDGEEETQ